MMKSFVFLSVFISTSYILVQGIDQQSSGNQCNCCDQCVSKILSNLLVNVDHINTSTDPIATNSPSSTAPSTNDIGVTTTTTSNPSTTQNPSTIIYSSETRDSPATLNPSTTVNPISTVTSTSITDSSTKTESFTTINADAVTDPTFTYDTAKIVSPSKATITVSKEKMSVCPENCSLDISGEYCNCYLPAETKRTDDRQ